MSPARIAVVALLASVCTMSYSSEPAAERSGGKKRRERPRRILCFSASWCGACEQLKRDEFSVLLKKKWQIGPEATNHVQQIDIDKNEKLANKYEITSLPTLILVAHGREKERHGYLSAAEIARLWLHGGRRDNAEAMSVQYR